MLHQVQNKSMDYQYQPGILYRYNSLDSYVTSTSDDVISAGLFYDKNLTYPNWWRTVAFNKTLGLFGLRSTRGEPSTAGSGTSLDLPDGMTRTKDYAADFNLNYTHPGFKISDWYTAWMPGLAYYDFAYSVGMVTGEQAAFFGPARGDNSMFDKNSLPLQLSRPYFDCGQTNRWLVAASSPVLDFLPRYSVWQHLRRSVIAAASVVALDLSKVDLNPCLASSSVRCKNTTHCQAIEGGGFDPTAYQCECLPGYQYPPGQNGSFQGSDIAKATEQEFKAGFNCVEGSAPVQSPVSSRIDVTAMVQQMARVTSPNCASKRPPELTLSLRSRDILKRMSVEGQLALRLAHALSACLQTTGVVNGDFNLDARRLQKTHVSAELTSAVLASPRLLSATAIFDKGQFQRYENWTVGPGDDTYFVPHVWRKPDLVNAIDLGGQSAGPRWVKDILTSSRSSWSQVFARQSLKTVERWWEMQMNPNYQYSIHHAIYPELLHVPAYSDGQWLQAHFKCDGRVDAWVTTYYVPFFGSDFQLAGVVTVDVQVTEADLRAVA